MDLKPFEKFVGKEVELKKIASSRPGSMVGVGQFEQGEMDIHEYVATDKLPTQYGVRVTGFGFSAHMRTSPIVEVVEETETKLTFKTEGGTYTMELMGEYRYDCHNCDSAGSVQNMELKMGGLLCPKCRVILYYPGTHTYSKELNRRREKREQSE